VSQEAFLRAYTRIGSYDPARSFKTWLLSIAWRKALTRRRNVRTLLRRFVQPPAFGVRPQRFECLPVHPLGVEPAARLRGMEQGSQAGGPFFQFPNWWHRYPPAAANFAWASSTS
jgi:DNA-directed RNA polymerase specialized sigma24 family protein